MFFFFFFKAFRDNSALLLDLKFTSSGISASPGVDHQISGLLKR